MYPARMAGSPRGVFWVGTVVAAVIGALTIGFAVILGISTPVAWRYHDAPACSASVVTGCRSHTTVRVVNIETVKDQKGVTTRYRLHLSDGDWINASVVPAEWRAYFPAGFPADVERFDGHIFTVSAMGATVANDDGPIQTVKWTLPGILSLLGGIWYSIGFARAGRAAITGTNMRQPPEWMRWPRRVGFAVVAGGIITFGVAAGIPTVSFTTVLITLATSTVAAFAAIVAWLATANLLRARRSERMRPRPQRQSA